MLDCCSEGIDDCVLEGLSDCTSVTASVGDSERSLLGLLECENEGLKVSLSVGFKLGKVEGSEDK